MAKVMVFVSNVSNDKGHGSIFKNRRRWRKARWRFESDWKRSDEGLGCGITALSQNKHASADQRYVPFHDLSHPRELGDAIDEFLSGLATKRQV